MKIKILLSSTIFALCACQPEQTRWHGDAADGRPSPGQLVFEALSKNVAHQEYCLSEREVILSKNKEKFISKFNSLAHEFAPDGAEKEANNFINIIKNKLQKKDILKTADLIEKTSKNIINIDLVFIGKILNMNNRALEIILLRLLHDEDCEKILEALILALKSPLNDITKLGTMIVPVMQRNIATIDIFDLLQKIAESIDDTNKNKKIALNLLKLINKFERYPDIKFAAQGLNKITSDNQPHICISEKIAWLKEFKNSPSFALELGNRYARFGIWINKILKVKDLSASLTNFLEIVLANEETYNLLISHTKTLDATGVLDDIVELADMVSVLYPKADLEWIRTQAVSALSLDHLDNDALTRAITLARNLFPLDLPIAKAPIVIVGNVIFQILAANNQNRCVVSDSVSSYAGYIQRWSEEVVSFMRDPKNGLIPMLNTVRSNL